MSGMTTHDILGTPITMPVEVADASAGTVIGSGASVASSVKSFESASAEPIASSTWPRGMPSVSVTARAAGSHGL